MTELAKRIAALSPEKRQLLLQRLNEKKEEVTAQKRITPLSRESDLFPLSFAQQRLWFLDQLKPGNTAFNISYSMRLTGDLDVKSLEQSFQELVRRHETLRTQFIVVDGQPKQKIFPPFLFTLPIINLEQIPPEQKAAEILRLANKEAQTSFNLATDSLLRVTLLRLKKIEHILMFSMHHIISDAWSLNLLIQEITTLYAAFSSDYPSPLPQLPIQYADFAVYQRKWLEGEEMKTQLQYWQQHLSSQLPIFELPSDRPRPPVFTYQGGNKNLILSKTFCEQLKKFSLQAGTTLFMTMLAVFQVVLYYRSGQEDIIVGTDIANRNWEGTEGLIGFFANQLVLRTSAAGNPTFAEYLQRVREITLNAYSHQDLPFDILVNTLNPQRHLNLSPLFQIKVILEKAQVASKAIPGVNITPLHIDKNTIQLDLILRIIEKVEDINILLEYNTDLFDASTIQSLLNNLELVLNQILTQPTARLKELLEMMAVADEQRNNLEKTQHKQDIKQKLKTIKRQTINS